MKRSPLRTIVLMVGLWMAFAPAVALAPATAMAVHMGMPDDGGSGCCDGCPAMDCKVCASMCTNILTPAIEAGPGFLPAVGLHHARVRGRAMALSDHFLTPDPPPPRPVSLQ